MAFNLADVLKDAAAMDETMKASEHLEKIPFGLLRADGKNFYSMDGIDGLAENIELCGLMDPIRVRKEDDGSCRIVSGHRRTAAIRMIIEGGSHMFDDGVPCIVENTNASEAMQELRLIFANKDTRRMSSADIGRQADRVRELLYQLQAEGVEFPGRMRDHVADAVGISKSKLARIDAIRNNLCEELRGKYENGTLNEAVAYALSQQPKSDQLLITEQERKGERSFSGLYENAVGIRANALKGLREAKCEACDGCSCPEAEDRFRCMMENPYSRNCDLHCCLHCSDLRTCKGNCSYSYEKQKQLKQGKKAADLEEKARKEEEQRPDIELCETIWKRTAEARKKAGIPADDVHSAWSEHVYAFSKSDREKFDKREKGECSVMENGRFESPFGWAIAYEDMKKLKLACEKLGVSADYLIGRDVPETPEEAPEAEKPAEAVPAYNPLQPIFFESYNPPEGRYYCRIAIGETTIYQVLVRQRGHWFFSNGKMELNKEAKVTGWWPVPEVTE